jgi:hypothetical protein
LNGCVVGLKVDRIFLAGILQTSVTQVHSDVYHREQCIRRVSVLTGKNTYSSLHFKIPTTLGDLMIFSCSDGFYAVILLSNSDSDK